MKKRYWIATGFALLAGWLMPRWYAIPAVAALWTGIEANARADGLTCGSDLGIGRGHGGAQRVWLAYLGVYGLSFVFAMDIARHLRVSLLRRFLARRTRVARRVARNVAAACPYRSPGAGPDSAVVVQPNLNEKKKCDRAQGRFDAKGSGHAIARIGPRSGARASSAARLA